MKTKFKGVLTLILAFIVQITFAQERTISGTVSDESGPLPGVSILKKGTTQGTETDFDGNYTLQVKKGDVLVFSFVGMETVEKTVGGGKSLNVTLKNANVLEEVVVTGIVAQTKESLTGSVVEIKEDELTKVVNNNVVKGLTGKVAGVQIYSGSGRPGANPTVRFRGIGSLTGSSSPLYVVDGIPFPGNIGTINQNDIASVNFIKDASATALYGSRGANGVVVITTKKGKKGSINVNFDFKTSLTERAIKDYSYISSQVDYLKSYHKMLKNKAILDGEDEATAGKTASKDLFDGSNGLVYNPFGGDRTTVIAPDGTFRGGKSMWKGNWEDELFRTGVITNAYLGISGGSDKTQYFFSLGNENNNAYVVGNDFKRTTVKTNIKSEIFKNFKVNVGMNYTNIRNLGAPEEKNALYGPFGFVRAMPTIYPVYAVDHKTGKLFLDEKGNKQWDNEAVTSPNATGSRPLNPFTNPAAVPHLDVTKNKTDNLTSRAGFSYKFFNDFTFTYNLGYDVMKKDYTYVQSNKIGSAIKPNGRLSRESQDERTFTNQQILSWKKNFEGHKIELMVGHESVETKFNSFETTQVNQFLTGEHSPGLYGKPDGAEAIDGRIKNYRLEGYLARAMYNYDGKYFVNFSFRRDGSSVFHPDNRWGNFYGGGIAWKVSGEKFMKNVNWLNNLKLKASFGELGNDIVYYPNTSTRNYAPYLDQWDVTRNGEGFELAKNILGNKNISWEKTTNINAGFELGMFDNRVTMEAEFFIRKVTDMLYNRPLAKSTGMPSVPENVMSMENKGFEFTLGVDIIRNENLTWNVSFNGTHYKNKITKLVPGKDFISASGNRRWQVGYGAYDFYMREFIGVNKDTGAAIYATDEELDSKGNPTNGKTEDRTLATLKMTGKSSLPDFYGGFSNTLKYKNLDFSVDFSYQLGGYIYDYTYIGYFDGTKGRNLHNDFAKTWSYDNKDAQLPVVVPNTTNYNTSTIGLKDASYLSFNNITLGYTINFDSNSIIGNTSVRLYTNVNNVALFTKDGTNGFDPRMNITGVGSGTYAPLRTYSFGVNIKF